MCVRACVYARARAHDCAEYVIIRRRVRAFARAEGAAMGAPARRVSSAQGKSRSVLSVPLSFLHDHLPQTARFAAPEWCGRNGTRTAVLPDSCTFSLLRASRLSRSRRTPPLIGRSRAGHSGLYHRNSAPPLPPPRCIDNTDSPDRSPLPRLHSSNITSTSDHFLVVV